MKTEKNPKGAGRKTSVAERESFNPRFIELILYDKLSYTQFRDLVSKEFGVSSLQAELYYKETRQLLKDKFTAQTDEILNEQLGRYFDLLKRARKDGNDLVEMTVLKQLDKIFGLEATKKVDVSSGGKPITISINLESTE